MPQARHDYGRDSRAIEMTPIPAPYLTTACLAATANIRLHSSAFHDIGHDIKSRSIFSAHLPPWAMPQPSASISTQRLNAFHRSRLRHRAAGATSYVIGAHPAPPRARRLYARPFRRGQTMMMMGTGLGYAITRTSSIASLAGPPFFSPAES